jgi:hypothetical protein
VYISKEKEVEVKKMVLTGEKVKGEEEIYKNGKWIATNLLLHSHFLPRLSLYQHGPVEEHKAGDVPHARLLPMANTLPSPIISRLLIARIIPIPCHCA